MNTNLINEWIKNKNKLLFITGDPGTGKTKTLNNIIQDYESIELEYINKFSFARINYIFNTNNIESMIMNNKKQKVVYIEDNTYTNIKFFKSLVKLNNHIIITMSLPIPSKFMYFINSQYHIQLKKKYTVTKNMDVYYYNIFDIINNVLSKNIKINDTNIIYDDIIILYHLIYF